MAFTSISENDGFPAGGVEAPHPLDMLNCLILWHIVDDHLKYASIKGAGQQMAQFRCEAAAGDRIIPGCLNISNSALCIQLHNTMKELLICAALPAGQEQFELVKVVINIVYRGPKAMV